MATSQRRGVIRLAALIWMGVVSIAWATQATHYDHTTVDKPPFYQIDYHGKRAYILGSMHVGKADFYPMAAQIEAQFHKASALVVEANVDAVDSTELIKKYGFQPQTLASDTQQALLGYCQTRGPLCDGIKPLSPWLQSMQLSLARFAELGYHAQYGVDVTLMAQNQHRPIIELESTEFQLKLMASFNDNIQNAMIKEAIEVSDDDMRALVTAWRTGDDKQLAKMMTAQSQLDSDDEFIEQLLFKRNQSMAQRIEQLMTTSPQTETLFIVIGAGHLVGERSVPEYLTHLGATMTHCWQQQCG